MLKAQTRATTQLLAALSQASSHLQCFLPLGHRHHFSSSTAACSSSSTPERQRQLADGPQLADFIAAAAAAPATPDGGACSAASSSSGRSIPLNTHSSAEQLQQDRVQYTPQLRVLIQTYGCQMNFSDTESVRSVLATQQYTDAASEADADVVLLNTCAIRENAEARIWGRLGKLQALKRQRRRDKQPPLVVGVLGCMAERLKSKLLDQQKLADLVVGPDAYRDLPRILAAVQAGEAGGAAAMNVQLSLDETYADITPVRHDPNSVSAFVSIMRGCNNMCAFCIVPFTRGRERSRPVDSILREVQQLSEQGVREVTLLGQNVNSYADLSHLQQQQHQQQQQLQQDLQQQRQHQQQQLDSSSSSSSSSSVYVPGFSSVSKPKREGAVQFAELLDRVSQVDPEMRIRFTSPHPKDFTDDVLQVIASRPNVCSFLHMPAQSGSSSCLARMRRGYTREAYDSLVARVRDVIPNVALSTDIITGFSGETEAEHAETLDLLRATRYDKAFLFSYSERGKTYASRHLPDDVPEDVKERRLAEAFEAYRSGQAVLNQAEVGRVHLVLLDGRPRKNGQHSLQGRTCTMKRAILPEQPLPASLSALQQHAMFASSLLHSSSSSSSSSPVYAGPVSSVGTGDYVAVLVQQLAGTSTLLSAPLAKTSIREFVQVFGSTTPGLGQVPAWVQHHVQVAAARDGWHAPEQLHEVAGSEAYAC